MTFKILICQLINFLKFPEIYMYFRKRIFGGHIVIFAYHRVCPGEGNLSIPNIHPKEFEKQIIYLKENFKIYEVPVTHFKRISGTSKVTSKHIIKTIKDMAWLKKIMDNVKE